MITKRIKEDKLILRMKPQNASKASITATIINGEIDTFNGNNGDTLTLKEFLLFTYDAIEETLAELEAQEYERKRKYI